MILMRACLLCPFREAFQFLRALVVACVGLMPWGVKAQLDTLHVLPPLHSRDNAQIEDHWLYISTQSQEEVIVEITQGEGTPFPGSPFSVVNGTPLVVQVGFGQTSGSPLMVSNSELNTALDGRGLTVTASAQIYVNARYRSPVQAEALTAKGRKALGTEFRFLGTPMLSQQNIRSFVLGVMATEDGTEVHIDDFDPNVVFAGPGPGSPGAWDFTLNAGQTVVLSGYADNDFNLAGFVGAHITSTAPIAVSSGNWCGALQAPTDQDICIDQIVPYPYLGFDHVLVEGNGLPESEQGLVVATQDGTEVWVNDDPSPFATLDAGEWVLVPNAAFSGTLHENAFIRVTQPAYVAQFLAGAAQYATAGMNFLPPLNCGMPNEVDEIPSIQLIGSTSYSGGIFAITEAGATLTINGVDQTGAEPVAGNPDWETYKVEGLTGDVAVASTGPVAVGLFGSSGAAGWAGYYSGFSLNTSAAFDASLNVCEGDEGWVVFAGDTIGGGTLSWDFGALLATEVAPGAFTVEAPEVGNYPVSLVVTGEQCVDSLDQTLTFHPQYTATSTAVACEEYLWQGDLLTASGTYIDSLLTAAGCDSVLTLALEIGQFPSPLLTDVTGDTLIECPTPSSVVAGLPFVPEYAYAWTFTPFDDVPTDLDGAGPFAAYVGPGLYELVATSPAPCAHTATALIDVSEEPCDLLIPNVFSPNNDGRNDRFRIAGLDGFSSAQIRIYNRWGTLVFEHADFGKSAGWDPGSTATEGTYFFVLTLPATGFPFGVTDVTGTVDHPADTDLVRRGSFTLVR